MSLRAKQSYVSLFLAIIVLAGVMIGLNAPKKGFVSSEVRFSDASARSGLSIVPASCPSYPHVAGECNCTPSYYCSGDDRWYIDATCVDSFVETCPYGCSAGVCLPQASITFTEFSAYYDETGTEGALGGDILSFTASGHLQVVPALIRSGNFVSVYWNVENATSCTVTGSNGDSWSGVFSGSYGTTSSALTEQAEYTLDCDALPDATPTSITETAIVNIIPIFEEQ